MTQFNPSGNSTAFPDTTMTEEVSCAPSGAEDVTGSPGPVLLPVTEPDNAADDAQSSPELAEDVSPDPEPVLLPVAEPDALSSPELAPLPPPSAPLAAVTRKSRVKATRTRKQPTRKQPTRSRKRPLTPSPLPSPERSPIPVLRLGEKLRLFKNSETDGFMSLAKRIRQSRKNQEQNK